MFRFIPLLLIATLLTIGCTERTVIYTGKEIELDFSGIRSFEPGQWIKVGETKITHSDDYEEQKKRFVLPASKSVYYKQGRAVYEPNNPFYIGLVLGRNVDQYIPKSDDEEIIIKEEKRFLMHIYGILILTEKNGNEFSIEVPADYPLKIKVLK